MLDLFKITSPSEVIMGKATILFSFGAAKVRSYEYN